MGLRVVQWTTGNVGKRSVIAVCQNPDLELVGCFAWDANKVGRDVGELVGIDPIGITATNDVDALLALRPDCVVYNPMWADIDEMVRILSAGINICSTAAWITGASMGADRQRIADACQRGGSTMFGTGVNPGVANLMAIVAAGLCERIDKITITEAADIAGYDSPATELPVGFAQPIDAPGLAEMTAEGTRVFVDAVSLIGEAIGVSFDEIVCHAEYGAATEDIDLGSWMIPSGCVGAVRVSWNGMVAGKSLVELRANWRKTQQLDRDWPIEHGYFIDVEGLPTLRIKLDILPPKDFRARTFSDFMALGMILTALPAVNAIPRVVAAEPGIVTYNDMLLPLPRVHIRGVR